MTDAVCSFPNDDASGSRERTRLLRRIAESLNLPLAAFTAPLATTPSLEGPSTAESAAVLSNFSRIRDPDMRRKCLEMLERCAKASAPTRRESAVVRSRTSDR